MSLPPDIYRKILTQSFIDDDIGLINTCLSNSHFNHCL